MYVLVKAIYLDPQKKREYFDYLSNNKIIIIIKPIKKNVAQTMGLCPTLKAKK